MLSCRRFCQYPHVEYSPEVDHQGSVAGVGMPALAGKTGLNGLSHPIRMSGAPVIALPSGEIPGTRVNVKNRYLSWNDVCHIVDHIVSQATGHFDAVVAISRGGIVPAGLRERIEMAGGEVVTAVLHYCPTSAAAFDQSPDIFGEQTEDVIVYPWQAERGKLGV